MRFSQALRKFLLAYFLVHFVLAAIFLYWVASWMNGQLANQTRDRLQSLGLVVQQHIQTLPQGINHPELEKRLAELARTSGTDITLTNLAGKVVVDSAGRFPEDNLGNRPEMIQARESGIGFDQRFNDSRAAPYSFLAIPITTRKATSIADENGPANEGGQSQSGFIQIAVNDSATGDTIASLQQYLWIFVIGIAVLAGLLIALFHWRETRMLRTFTKAARTVASGQYATLPGIFNRQDEWKSLSQAFTVMQSELEQRESMMQEDSLRIQAVLASMIEGVLAVDAANCVLVANQAACELLGTSQENLLGKNLIEVVRVPELSKAVNQTMLTQSATQTEFDTSGINRRRTLEVRVAPLSEKHEFGATMVLHDVTDLRALETMRRDFVANVSHELKTPLASIKAYAETLRMGAINDADHNVGFIQQIEEQAEVLDHQIADLLKLSELESGKSTFHWQRVDLNSLFSNCRSRFELEADRRNLEIKIDAPKDGGEIWTDPVAIKTVLDNLVSNALRYARPSGFVQLSGRQDVDSWSISVMDNGIGISVDNQERVFERFYRVDSARSRELGGTGLGLAIVKHTVNAMGGTISLHSKPGQGSTFTVTLPKDASDG